MLEGAAAQHAAASAAATSPMQTAMMKARAMAMLHRMRLALQSPHPQASIRLDDVAAAQYTGH